MTAAGGAGAAASGLTEAEAARRLPAVLAQHALPARLVRLIEHLHAHFNYLDEKIADIETRRLS